MSAYGYTFGRVPDSLLFSGASDRACRLYAILTRYADQHVKGDPPTRPQLAAYLDCSVDSVDRTVKELANEGWLEVLPRSSKLSPKVRDANDYHLLPGPEDRGVAARVRPGGSRTRAATRTSGNDETAGNGGRTGAARGSRTGAATYKEVVKTDTERRKTGATAPTPDPDGSASPASALGRDLDPSPGNHGSPSPHGGGPPPSRSSQNRQQEQIFETPLTEQERSKAVNAGTLVDEYMAGFEHEKRPPKQHIGHIASQTKKLLDEGITPDRIRPGLALVRERGLPPSALPNAVVQAEALAKSRNGRRPVTNGNGRHVDPEEELRRAREFNARQAERRRAAITTERGRRLAAELAAKGASQ